MDVWAYASTDQVELFLNGESLGRKTKTEGQFHLMWRVPYEAGIIRAVSYGHDGEQILEQEIHTAGEPARIELMADRTEIDADGRDLSFVNVSVVDADGNLVLHADNLIEFEIQGPASVAGVDNGNPVSHEPFKADYRKVFNRRAQAIIQSMEEPGQITVTMT